MKASVPGTTPAQMANPATLISSVTTRPTARAIMRFSMPYPLIPRGGQRQSVGARRRRTRYRLPPAWGPLSKLVDETDSKSVAAYPASRFESGEGHGAFHCVDGQLAGACSQTCSKLVRSSLGGSLDGANVGTQHVTRK